MKPYSYHILGKGKKTLLFLHGIGDKTTSWLDLKEKIDQEYQIILLELPGHGNISSDELNPATSKSLISWDSPLGVYSRFNCSKNTMI